MYNSITSDISVSVLPVYIDERSKPEDSRYFWAYRVVVENRSGEPVQLVSRYWHITDGNGHVEEVSGAGVVGEQPLIKPGGSFEYTSGCPLDTPSGIMAGHYVMKRPDDSIFEVAIPAFSLDLPDCQPTYN
ncbi:MAG: Co2+/Mg2+ efflux protein ApaG [Rhizobiaceae bacterium]|nr:Co2+/Mg2+ efflux protein ApaG [Rhizobiaceae bacterium]